MLSSARVEHFFSGKKFSEMHTLEGYFWRLSCSSECGLLLGRWIGGAAATCGRHYNQVFSFLVLWLAATLVNMWVGVSKAG